MLSPPRGQVLTDLGSASGHNSSRVEFAVPREPAEQEEPLPYAGGPCPGLGTGYLRGGKGSSRVLELPEALPPRGSAAPQYPLPP